MYFHGPGSCSSFSEEEDQMSYCDHDEYVSPGDEGGEGGEAIVAHTHETNHKSDLTLHKPQDLKQENNASEIDCGL